MGDPSLDGLTAALYTHADVASLTRVLTTSLAGLLPPSMVTVQRRRSVADRMAGRPGEAVALTVRCGDRELDLRVEGSTTVATTAHVVRGVRLSQTPVGLDEWVATLARELARLADADRRARDTLDRFLLG